MENITMTEAVKKILDRVYAAREQIYGETKNLDAHAYTAYFNDHAQAIIKRNGYTAERSKDGLGYICHRELW
jgi:hypothetical protein